MKKRLGERELAEDIVHHAFWKLYENRRSLGDAGHVYGFLFVVARNEAVGDLRRRRRQRAADYEQARMAEQSYSDPQDDERERAESVVVVCELIELLPPGRRRIIRLNFLDGLTVREIANVLNLTETTVRNQRNRALVFLKKTLR